jgi:hypothetical protein
VVTARHRSAVLLLAAAALLAGCSTAGTTPQASDAATPTNDADAATLVQLALVARGASDIPTFAATLAQAADVCADPQASARLDQVAAVAQRWADSLADGRPKVQATSETLLAEVPWDELAARC